MADETLKSFVEKCAINCNCNAEMNTANQALVLISKLAEEIDNRGGVGGGGKEDFIITLSDTTVTFPKTYNQLKAEYGNDILKNINVVIKKGPVLYYPYKISESSGRLIVRYFNVENISGTETLEECYFTVLWDDTSSTVNSNKIG